MGPQAEASQARVDVTLLEHPEIKELTSCSVSWANNGPATPSP